MLQSRTLHELGSETSTGKVTHTPFCITEYCSIHSQQMFFKHKHEKLSPQDGDVIASRWVKTVAPK